MKKRRTFLFIFFFVGVLPLPLLSQNLNINFRTVTDNGSYSPKHVLAIWIEDSSGTFIKSLMVRAEKRIQYLYSWNAKSGGNKTDAITGATLTSHQTHQITWNCKNLSGKLVSPGSYKIQIEFTDQHAQGPKYSIPFKVGPEPESKSLPDQMYFKNLSSNFVPQANSFSEKRKGSEIKIYPNPNKGLFLLTFPNSMNGPTTVIITDMSGKSAITYLDLDNTKQKNFNISNRKAGIYILEVNYGGQKIIQKIIKE